MSQLNNPAGRLLKIIKTGRSKPGDSPAVKVWPEILSVPPENKSVLLRRIGLILALPSEIAEKIHSIEEIDSIVYLKWLPKVEQAFSTLNFQIQWKQFMSHFDPSVEYGLEICSEVLSRKRPENTATKKSIENITKDIEELINFVGNESLDSGTKIFIISSLQSLLKSIGEIPISGTLSLEKEFNAIIGSVVIHNNYSLDSKKSESAKKFWKIITGISLILSISANATLIGEKLVHLLPENSSVIEKTIESTDSNQTMV